MASGRRVRSLCAARRGGRPLPTGTGPFEQEARLQPHSEADVAAKEGLKGRVTGGAGPTWNKSRRDLGKRMAGGPLNEAKRGVQHARRDKIKVRVFAQHDQ